MRIAIVGTRPPRGLCDASDMAIYIKIVDDVRAFVMALPQDSIVISGGAYGVDMTAETTAAKRGLGIVEHLPDYERYPGHVAPLERNKLIVADCEILHAWPSPWSRGTRHVSNLAKSAGKFGGVHKPWEKT